MIEEAVERLFADNITPALLDEAEAGVWPGGLWELVEQQGLLMAMVPENNGGIGLDWADGFAIFRAAGRHRAPVPIVETILASHLLATAGIAVPEGPISLHDDGAGGHLNLDPAGGIWRLSGIAANVPWGIAVDHVTLIARHGGTSYVVLAPAGDCQATAGGNLAGEPRDQLQFEDCPVTVAELSGEPAMPARSLGAMARAAQLAGAFEAMLAATVSHVRERRQFGRQLAAFQAVQNNLAVLAGEVAATGVAAKAAFLAADRGDPTFEVAVAKLRTSAAVGPVTSIAHQLAGAMGFTREHQLQYLTRRAWAWRGEFGGEREWATLIGQSVSENGADGIWPYLTSR